MQTGTRVTSNDATAKQETRPHYYWCESDRAIRPGYDNHAPLANEGRWPTRRLPELESACGSCVYNHLPFKIPSNFRGRAETVVNGCTLISGPKSCLSRRVSYDRDAIAYESSSQRAAVRFPVFSCEYGQEMQRKAACM